MKEILDVTKRTIPSATMTSVMAFAPMDGFALTDDMLNKVYTTTGVNITKFGDTESFMVTAEAEDGKVINLSARLLKGSRVLGKADAKPGKAFEGTTNVFVRSEAEEIWNASTYFHAVRGMKKDEEFVVPERFKLRYAVLAEDQETKKPRMNPFNYKGYRKVVDAYAKKGTFPTEEDFKEELLKSVAEGRIAGLPTDLTTPTPNSWIKGEVKDFRSTLILEDFEQ